MRTRTQKHTSSVRYRIARRGELVPTAQNVVFSAHKQDYRKSVGGIFLGLLLILIFFSKTIYSYNLPVVTAVKPENGRLEKSETSSGIASFDVIENIYAAVGGKVDNVHVKVGDKVEAGQTIYSLSFDADSSERKLLELQNNKIKLNNDIQAINIKLEKLERYMTALSGEKYEEDRVSSYELDALAFDIRKARAEYNEIRDRHDDDEATDLELERARIALQSFYLRQDELERKYAEQNENAKKMLDEQEKSRDTRLKDYEADIAALKLDLQARQLELNNITLQEEPYKKSIADYESNAEITAPVSGTVLSLPVQKGESLRAEQLIASIGEAGAFTIECTISLENNFVLPGDVVELSNSSHVLEAVVSTITPDAHGKRICINIESDKITAGETFEVSFTKKSDITFVLVPNGALNQDNDGYFVNLVKKRNGIMGEEYYLERLDVFIGDSDAKNTVITRGIMFFEPITLLSDKAVVPGDVVTVANVGDFFEK